MEGTVSNGTTSPISSGTLRIRLTDDHDLRDEIRQALQLNGGYCPCSLDKTDDTRCMCKAFREQQMMGSCHCGLYIKYQ